METRLQMPEYTQYPGRSESIESELAEKIAGMFEGEYSSKEVMAHKTLHILNQKDRELSTLAERIKLLEALKPKQLVAEDESPTCHRSPRISSQNNQYNASEEYYSSEAESTEACQRTHQMTKNETAPMNSKVTKKEDESLAKTQKTNEIFSNAQLLSAIYNETLKRKDEQSNFVKIVVQLNEIVQSLKDQKDVKNKKFQEIYNNTKGNSEFKFSQEFGNSQRKKEQSIERNETQAGSPKGEKVFNAAENVNSTTSLPVSTHSYTTECTTKKMDGLMSISTKCISNSKFLKNKFKKLNLKLRKHERCLSKTKSLYQTLKEQGRTLVSMVYELKTEQQKEKDLTERLLHKIDEITNSDNWADCQAIALNHLEERLTKVELRLVENKTDCTRHEEEINTLKQKLYDANKLKEEFKNNNSLVQHEFSELNTLLSEERKKIEDLKETVRKERALNETMKHSYEIQVANLVSSAVSEYKDSFSETKKVLENEIKSLQSENSDLKSKISQMEDEWKKMSSEYKMKSTRAKKFLRNQVSIASQKLIYADFKIKEFFLTVEKLLRGLHRLLFEGELETIRKKCQEEGGVQTASSILGVTPSEMTKVLAAGYLPNLTDWLDNCKKLAYKDKFADELASFIISICQKSRQKYSTKGSGDKL